MKDHVFWIVRQAHAVSARGPLPRRLAVYFHALERPDHGRFRDAMTCLAERGYVPVTPARFAEPGGEDKRLFVSFDDNFRSWHAALGMFDDLKLTATFYVNSHPFRDTAPAADIADYFARIRHDGEQITLSRGELREIADAGHTIGCRTHTHPVLSALPTSAWADEIDRSKSILEDLVDAPVTDFSYPFGMRRHFSRPLRSYCAAEGFRTIATGIPGMQQADRIDPLTIHRTGWRFDRTLERNLENLAIDGEIFARLTGRSAIG